MPWYWRWLLGLIQAITPIIGARGNDAALMGLASSTSLMQFAFVGLAFLALIVCYVTSDFSVATVYENAHSTMPLIYKITSVWGNHEGSMLLWVLILSFFGALVGAFGQQPAFNTQSVRTGSAIVDRLRFLLVHPLHFQSLSCVWRRPPSRGVT